MGLGLLLTGVGLGLMLTGVGLGLMLTGVGLGFATKPTATRKADAKQRTNPYRMTVDCVVGYGVYTRQHFGMLNTRQ